MSKYDSKPEAGKDSDKAVLDDEESGEGFNVQREPEEGEFFDKTENAKKRVFEVEDENLGAFDMGQTVQDFPTASRENALEANKVYNEFQRKHYRGY